MKKVSVIIPIYNASSTLEKCLNSIINQTYKNLEIICIDDSSTDSSLDIIKEYKTKDNRIVLLTNDVNSGPGYTKEKGITNATGDYLAFVDSDDYIELNMMEKMLDYIALNKLDIVRCSYSSYINNKLYKNDMSFDTGILNSTLKEKFIIGLLNGSIPAYMQLLIINKRFLDKAKIELGKQYFLEDLLFYLKLFNTTNKIGIINETLYNYVINDNGITFSLDSEKINKRISDTILYNKEAKKIFKNKDLDKTIDTRTTYLLIHSLYELYCASKNNKKIIIKHLKNDNIIHILNNSKQSDDKFTKVSLKLIKNKNYTCLFAWFSFTKTYINLKRKFLKW